MTIQTNLRRCWSCGAWEPVSTTCVAESQRAEHEAKHRDLAQQACIQPGYISPDGDYCEREAEHESDHGAFECRLCWNDYESAPKTWTRTEGRNVE